MSRTRKCLITDELGYDRRRHPYHARERRYAAKRHDIAGHIARTAEQIALFSIRTTGRFRRNAIRIA